jgi:hypothetical protein
LHKEIKLFLIKQELFDKISSDQSKTITEQQKQISEHKSVNTQLQNKLLKTKQVLAFKLNEIKVSTNTSHQNRVRHNEIVETLNKFKASTSKYKKLSDKNLSEAKQAAGSR